MVYRRRPELIIFDLDGTILNSEPASIKCWVEALNDLGYEASAADILPFIGKNLKLIEAEARLRWENLDFKRAHDRKVELNEKINQRGVEIKPGVIRVLDLLDEAGIKRCIATSSRRNRSIRLLSQAEIYQRFGFLISGEEVENSKPHPEIFLKCMTRADVEPTASIVVEDSRFGIEGGRRSGAFTVLIPDLIAPDDEMLKNADRHFDSMHGLYDYLRKNLL